MLIVELDPRRERGIGGVVMCREMLSGVETEIAKATLRVDGRHTVEMALPDRPLGQAEFAKVCSGLEQLKLELERHGAWNFR